MNSFSLLFCGLLCLISVAYTGAQLAAASHLFLYTGHNYTDDGLGTNNPIPDLAEYGFDDKAHSVRYNGVWLFYENANYNEDEEGQVLWRLAELREAVEVFNSTQLGGKLSSVRPVGNLLPATWYQANTLTFFQKVNFTGTPTRVIKASTPELSFPQPQSLIILGPGSWTFYDRTDFGGNAHCVNTTATVSFFPDMESMNSTLKTIESVEAGCFAKHGVPYSYYLM